MAFGSGSFGGSVLAAFGGGPVQRYYGARTYRTGAGEPQHLYYHFENIDEMALNLTSKNVPHELVELVSSLIKGQDIATKFGDFANNAGLELRFKRLQLLLRHGGSQLIELGKRRIVPQYLSILGVDINALSAADRARMTFMMGGVIALISSEEVGSFAHYLELLQSGIADAAAALWRQMGKD